MNENTPLDNNKTLMALSALMFFAPLVQHTITQDKADRTASERSFISEYVRYGYITLTILVVTILVNILNISLGNTILSIIAQGLIWVLLASLVTGSVFAIAGKSLTKHLDHEIESNQIKTNAADILFSFIPVYNYSRRYKLANYQHPYRWLKESLLRWTFFTIVGSIWQNTYVISLMIVLIIVRLGFLVWGIDMMDTKTKEFLNHLFSEHPEEITGYATGSIAYVIQRMRTHDASLKIQDSIKEHKKIYSTNLDIKEPSTRIEYGILFVGLIRYSYDTFVGTQILASLLLLPLLLVALRYLIMIPHKKLPPIPFIHELVLRIEKIRK